MLFLAGSLTLEDLTVQAESEEQQLDRTLRTVMDDKKVRSALPIDVWSLPLEAKRALVLMYCELTSKDLCQVGSLAGLTRWLQPAAEQHARNTAQAAT